MGSLQSQNAIGESILNTFARKGSDGVLHDADYYNNKYGYLGGGNTKEIIGAGLSEGGNVIRDIGGYFNYVPHPLAKGFGMATNALGTGTQVLGDAIEGEKQPEEIGKDAVAGLPFLSEIKKLF